MGHSSEILFSGDRNILARPSILTRLLMVVTSTLMLSGILVGLPTAQASASGADWVTVAAGYQHTCGTDTEQRISCWGVNDYGQVGDGTYNTTEVPTLVKLSGSLAGLKFNQVSASYTHTCALTVDGAAYCWGRNDQGQLGNTSITQSTNVPVPVDTSGVLDGLVITQIDTGFNHTCVLSDGSVYCWGANDDGQIGDGTFDYQPTPVAVDTSDVLAGKTIKEIGVGSLETCALDTDGMVYCWGYGREGQIGDGTGTILNPYPVAVKSDGELAGKTIAHISVGDAQACAVDVDGQTYCWGLNDAGQLGNGNKTTSNEPVVVSQTGILQTQTPSEVEAGGTFGCILTAEGKIACWGDGNQGQLGNGQSGATQPGYHSTEPTNVLATGSGVLSGVTLVYISSGFAHTCVVSTTGRTYCWGLNDYGQLGNGVSTSVATGIPVLVKDPPPLPPTLLNSNAVVDQGTVGTYFVTTKLAEKASGYALRFSVKSGTLPPGILLNRLTGYFTGTPTTAGTYNIVVAITNAGGSITGNQTITIKSVSTSASATPTPSASVVAFKTDIGRYGKGRGVKLTPLGVVYPRVTTQYAGPIRGTVNVLYKNKTTGKINRFYCGFKTFGMLKANPKLKANKKVKGVRTSTFPQGEYTSSIGCNLPLAARETLKTEKIQLVINLYFQRRWPTTYKAVTPNGKKIVPWKYEVTITAGAGRVTN